MPMGNGLDENNVLGPVQNKKQFDIVSGLVEDAKKRGGRVVTGGAPATELGALFYPVTIVADLHDGDPLVDEEQFGPALPVIKYTDVEDAIASANALEVGPRRLGVGPGCEGRASGREPRSTPAPCGSTATAACTR